jgi:hypothetical protein
MSYLIAGACVNNGRCGARNAKETAADLRFSLWLKVVASTWRMPVPLFSPTSSVAAMPDSRLFVASKITRRRDNSVKKVAVGCPIAATDRRSAMPKQTRKHDSGGRPSIGKPNRDKSRLEDASAKQRKQHAHKAPVRRAASKFRE